MPSGTEQEVGDRTAEDSAAAAAEVEWAGAAPDEAGAAATLIETAAQAVAPTDQAGAVVAGAQEALTEQADTPVSADAERGRQLLKAAMLKHMAPLQALDARVYLAINGVPHPSWLDAVGHGIAVLTRGGALWLAGTSTWATTTPATCSRARAEGWSWRRCCTGQAVSGRAVSHPPSAVSRQQA